MNQAPRTPTPTDRLAEETLEATAALDPEWATQAGLAGHDHRLSDHSAAGTAERAALQRSVLRRLDDLTPQDDTDRVTADVLRERADVQVRMAEAGELTAQVDVLASPVQSIRDSFDLMPRTDAADWALVAERMRAVPAAVAGYEQALREGAAAGTVAAARQVRAGAVQCDANVGEDGFFVATATRGHAATDGPGEAGGAGSGLPAELLRELDEAAAEASQAYRGLAALLREELLPVAPEADAVGEERYALRLESYLGTRVDLAETYAWGLAEVERLRAEGTAVARTLGAGSIEEAAERLEHDPSRLVEGPEAFRDWMQAVSDEAVQALAGSHFDIPEQIRTLDCRIAPTSTGVVYYTAPSEDLTRSGSMWWSVPRGMTRFSTWQQRTTVYHEGVPGHHLQLGQTVLRSDALNRWRRRGVWVSGHGEGWALYAEQLMAELGHLDDPGDHLGLIASQLLRSVRVVLDVGVHCGMPAPESVGGGSWTYDKAWRYLSGNVPEPEPTLRFELDRYLGHPGQAPSYKVGERAWLGLRRQAQQEQGPGFDLTAWHRRALDLGSMGLDSLARALAAPA